eukprot:TRINITY_DN22330_c0_g1_i1.p1 TRINITY_DN22330_c0_g1~~TRINITY_DN22330_c0_g1_i1.p1  ORF type:complete len:260 (+),score=14.24 TRINITY_DN22330_c0_g1_i1:106-885(+)
MGKLNYEHTINHFGHPHPLELSNLQNQTLNTPICYGCNQKCYGLTYTCKFCNIFLHTTCSQMPNLINHPFHPNHPLSLLPLPAYAEGFFKCDACGEKGNGFSYHCVACNIDLHVLCATRPLSVSNQSHHQHPLGLAFFPPYENKGFSCDICKNSSSNTWLYRCNICEFDAHLGCATAIAQQVQQPMGFQQHRTVQGVAPQQFQAPRGGGFVNGARPSNGQNYYVNNPNDGGVRRAVQPAGRNGSGTALVKLVVRGLIGI